jgi:hypothetical protein
VAVEDVSSCDHAEVLSVEGRPQVDVARTFSVPLGAVLACGLAVSITLGFALRALGRGLLAVPSDLPSLAIAALLPATILPVLGNCFGYWMSFRVKPSAHSMRLFIAVGAVMSLVGVAITSGKLPASASAGSVATTLAVSLTPSVVTVVALLLFVSRHPSRR